jgi:hypothetical protein
MSMWNRWASRASEMWKATPPKKQVALAGAVADQGEGDVAEDVEDDDERDQDVPAGQVALGQVFGEPADEEVVQSGEEEGRAQGEVRAHVRQDGDLGGPRDAGAEEGVEEGSEGTLEDPAVQGVEDHLADAVGVLLPAGNFVVDVERHALLEVLAVVRGEADDVARDLQAERDVEVLGDVVFGPVADETAVVSDAADVLELLSSAGRRCGRRTGRLLRSRW